MIRVNLYHPCTFKAVTRVMRFTLLQIRQRFSILLN
jgi:hypothetical protein